MQWNITTDNTTRNNITTIVCNLHGLKSNIHTIPVRMVDRNAQWRNT